MSGSGSSQQPVTTTQTSDPWSGAQPHLLRAMQDAQNNLNTNTGYQPWGGLTQADIDPNFATGWSGAYGIAAPQNAAGGPTSIQHAISLADMMMGSQGLTADQQSYAIPTLKNYANQYNDVYGRFGDVYGKGGDVYGRAGDVYSEASGQENPYLLQQLAAQDRRIGDKINSSMSGSGRYGSGAHTDVMARSLAEASYPILAQDYSQRQQTRLAALAGQQAALAGQGQALQGQMGATAGGAGVVKDISDIENQGLQTAGKFAQLMPGLEEARYGPSDHMMALGNYYNDRAQKDLDRQIQYWNASQAYPWEQLQRYNAIVSGAGGLGGTRVTSSPSTAPPLTSRILGGAITGGGLGSMFGVPGAAAGAVGGGLLGLLG